MTLRKGLSRSRKETNSTVYKKLRRVRLRCPICPPNRGENAKRHAKYGVTKPKSKEHR